MMSTFRCALATMLTVVCMALAVAGQDSTTQIISGVVRDSDGVPVSGATIRVEIDASSHFAQTTTGKDGTFSLRCPKNQVLLRVQKTGFHDVVQLLPEATTTDIRLVISPLNMSAPANTAPPSPNSSATEFDDKPNFTVAGITDWTAAGGHGSDGSLRASESLAKDARSLGSKSTDNTLSPGESESALRAAIMHQPDDFEANHALGTLYLQNHRFGDAIPLLGKAFELDSTNYENSYELAEGYEGAGEREKARNLAQQLLARGEHAELHRLLGDIEEASNHPLAAEREYEKAVRQNASEENYFDWAGELLVHRAVGPAIEVFTNGARLYPRSERMLAGLGAALFANAQYALATERVCEASDLDPLDPNPYLFLGKMEQASSEPLPCVKEKLARFAHDQPENPWANFYYAFALARTKDASSRGADTSKVEALLQNAIRVDPKFAQAYLQLGILFSQRGDFLKAIDFYERSIAADPNLPEAHFRLAQSYRQAGDNKRAEGELQVFDRVKRSDAAQVEEHRREIRQFVVVLRNSAESPTK